MFIQPLTVFIIQKDEFPFLKKAMCRGVVPLCGEGEKGGGGLVRARTQRRGRGEDVTGLQSK
jgi:NAD(P)H-hydrate repair Nnr-like enzyme with NAD(P)H-hydrate epimerase domain